MRQESAKQLGHRQSNKWDTGEVLLDESVIDSRFDFAAMFGNTRPVEIEIGCGKGTFILARSQSRPEINMLGLEYARAYAAYCADRLNRAGVTNARMLGADADHVVTKCVPDNSVFRMHIYFPDPWPKRRHNRRRLIQKPFLAQARRVLQVGGQLIVVTDHFDYFRHIRRTLYNAEGFARIPMPRMTDAEGEIVGTNFERKYIAQGRPFYSTALMKFA
jgi:tRNA (guanine-N7-)-methyltransferase